jgi:hypothetical protein
LGVPALLGFLIPEVEALLTELAVLEWLEEEGCSSGCCDKRRSGAKRIDEKKVIS